jgi:hypothetical protein
VTEAGVKEGEDPEERKYWDDFDLWEDTEAWDDKAEEHEHDESWDNEQEEQGE